MPDGYGRVIVAETSDAYVVLAMSLRHRGLLRGDSVDEDLTRALDERYEFAQLLNRVAMFGAEAKHYDDVDLDDLVELAKAAQALLNESDSAEWENAESGLPDCIQEDDDNA